MTRMGRKPPMKISTVLMISSTPINTDPDMDGEGYRINMEKKDGKWQVKSEKSSSNYNFESLTQTFRGGLYE